MSREKLTIIEGNQACEMKGGDEGYCPCPLNDAMALLGSKWTLSIIVTVGNFGRLRFHELEERLKGIGTKTLARRLKELQRMGLLGRETFAEVPPRVEYYLTDDGKRLREAAVPLLKWAAAQ